VQLLFEPLLFIWQLYEARITGSLPSQYLLLEGAARFASQKRAEVEALEKYNLQVAMLFNACAAQSKLFPVITTSWLSVIRSRGNASLLQHRAQETPHPTKGINPDLL